MSGFCQQLQGRTCQGRGLGGQKKPKSCQRSLLMTPILFSTILYIQHPAHFPGQKRSIFSCWFQLAFCSVQLALGEFVQSSKDLFYVP